MQPEAQQWIINTVENGRVEPQAVVEGANTAVWGPKVLVGAPGKLGTMYQLLPVHTYADFWELPAGILERDRLALEGATTAAVQHELMPRIGYDNVPVAQRPTAKIRQQQEKSLRSLTSAQPQSQPVLTTCESSHVRKRVRNQDAILDEADSAAEAHSSEDEDPLGKVLDPLDEEHYQPREKSMQTNRFF